MSCSTTPTIATSPPPPARSRPSAPPSVRALPFVIEAHDHGVLTAAIRHGMGDVVLALAPVIVVGGALAAVLAPHHRRSPATIVNLVAGPFTAIGLIAAAYIVAGGEVVLPEVPAWIGGGAAVVLAAVALARIATAGFMAWLNRNGGGHGHHHHH